MFLMYKMFGHFHIAYCMAFAHHLYSEIKITGHVSSCYFHIWALSFEPRGLKGWFAQTCIDSHLYIESMIRWSGDWVLICSFLYFALIWLSFCNNILPIDYDVNNRHIFWKHFGFYSYCLLKLTEMTKFNILFNEL